MTSFTITWLTQNINFSKGQPEIRLPKNYSFEFLPFRHYVTMLKYSRMIISNKYSFSLEISFQNSFNV